MRSGWSVKRESTTCTVRSKVSAMPVVMTAAGRSAEDGGCWGGRPTRPPSRRMPTRFRVAGPGGEAGAELAPGSRPGRRPFDEGLDWLHKKPPRRRRSAEFRLGHTEEAVCNGDRSPHGVAHPSRAPGCMGGGRQPNPGPESPGSPTPHSTPEAPPFCPRCRRHSLCGLRAGRTHCGRSAQWRPSRSPPPAARRRRGTCWVSVA